MSNDSQFRAFPKSETEALAYLYIKQQDLSQKTPSEIAKLYRSAYEEITDTFRKLRGVPPKFNSD